MLGKKESLSQLLEWHDTVEEWHPEELLISEVLITIRRIIPLWYNLLIKKPTVIREDSPLQGLMEEDIK